MKKKLKTKIKGKKKNLLVEQNHPALRSLAKPVPLVDIKSPKIRAIIARMKMALRTEEDGVAIAAPQVGKSLQIFLISAEALKKAEKTSSQTQTNDLVFINPELVKVSKDKMRVEEGCLSLRWLYGQVLRSNKATVRAYNERGVKFEKGASGLLAQIFQHEIDHLNGILFTDKARNLQNIPPTRNITSSRKDR